MNLTVCMVRVNTIIIIIIILIIMMDTLKQIYRYQGAVSGPPPPSFNAI